MVDLLRHLLGVVFGVMLTVITWSALGWSTTRIHTEYAQYFGLKPTGTLFLALLLIAIVAVGLGLAAAARFMSPIAALIPGVIFFVLGLAELLLPAQTQFLSDIDPMGGGTATFSLSAQGIYPLLGLMLIVSAIPPHRWRAASAR